MSKAIITELEKFADWEPKDSPRALAMRSAATALRQLSGGAIEDPSLQAKSLSIEVEPDTKELRLAIYREHKQEGLLGYLILETPEVYDLGTDLLKRYDKLEGIK